MCSQRWRGGWHSGSVSPSTPTLHLSRCRSAFGQHSDLWGAAGNTSGRFDSSALVSSALPAVRQQATNGLLPLPPATSAFSCLCLYVQRCCSAELKQQRENEGGSLICLLLLSAAVEPCFTENWAVFFTFTNTLKMSHIIRNLLRLCFLTVATQRILCQLGPNVQKI